MRATLTILLLSLLSPPAVSGRVGSQTLPSQAPDSPDAGEENLELELLQPDAVDAWAELTPLGSDEPREVFFWGEGSEPRQRARGSTGPMMVCRGAPGEATTCVARMLSAGETVEIDFEPGSRVAGSCSEAGKPARRARVAVVPQGLTTPRPFTLPLEWDGRLLERFVETGEDGSFLLPELAPGDYFLEITYPSGRVEATEPFTIARRRPEKTPPGGRPPVPVVDLGRFEVDAGLAVEFLVTDPSGLPVAGAQVGGGQGSSPRSWKIFHGETDEQGHAVVSGFQPDIPVQLTCRAPGFDPATFRFEAPPGRLDCALSPLVALQGRVVDPDGEPIEGATVSLAGTSAREVTREDGLFHLRELTVGEHQLTLAAAGFEAEEIEVALSPEEELQRLPPVTLHPAPLLSGLVRDGQTQEPVARAVVEILSPPGAGRTVCDDDGEFTLTAASSSGLRLEASAPGFAPRQLELSAERLGRDEPVVIELSRGGRIEVRVWDEQQGGPCQGCTVWLDGPSSLKLLTDESGEALTEPLDPGTYSLQRPALHHLGSQAVVEGGQEIRSATVRPGETTLVEMGERVVFQTLLLRPGAPAGWKLNTESPTRYDAYWPEADGSFRVRRKPDQPLTVSLVGPSGPDGLGPSTLLATLPPDASPGTETLNLPDTLARGFVARDGESVSRAAVELVAATDGTVWARTFSLEGGLFELSHAPPGVYLLRIDGQVVRSLSLARGERSELERVEIH